MSEQTIAGDIEVVKTSKVEPNDWNFNQVSTLVYKKLKKAIQRYGFLNPVVVYRPPGAKKLVIVDGEHRWLAAKELGLKEIRVLRLHELPDNDAKVLSVALNEIKGKANNDQLFTLLGEMRADGVDLSVLPYEDEDLTEFIRQATNADNIDDDLDDLPDDDEGEEGGTRKGRFDLAAYLQLKALTSDEEQAIVELIDDVRAMLGKQYRPMEVVSRGLRRLYKAEQRKQQQPK